MKKKVGEAMGLKGGSQRANLRDAHIYESLFRHR